MKNIYIALATFLTIFVTKVSANGSFLQIPPISEIDTLEELIALVTRLIVPIFLLTFLAMLLYGAFVYLTSRGDEAQVAKARRIIVMAVLGFTIAVLAQSITSLLSTILDVEG